MVDPSLKLPDPPAALAELSQRLCTRISHEIQQHGAIRLDQYMRMALYEPGLGYYSNGLMKFGAEGDFVTAPEQGRLFAKSLVNTLQQVAEYLGDGIDVLELGPGTGALARDLLSMMDPLPKRYRMLETSASLKQVQQQTLADLPGAVAERIEWIDRPPENDFCGVILGNEVIDALPVYGFHVQPQGLMELGVGLSSGRFDWQLLPPSDRLLKAFNRLSADLDAPLPRGYRSEICVDLPGWFKTITQSLVRGLVLMVDYGYPRREYYHPDRTAGTLVAHYRHRAHFDPFVWPGLTDLSAFVDFTALAEAGLAEGFEVAGFTSQAGFLLGSDVTETIQNVSDERDRLAMSAELKRLVLPGEMGEKFKLMALTRNLEMEPSAFQFSDQRRRL